MTQLSHHEHSQHSTLRWNGMESCLSCTAIQATALAVECQLLYIISEQAGNTESVFSLQRHVCLTWSLLTLSKLQIFIIVDNVTVRHWQRFLSLTKMKLVWLVLRAVEGLTKYQLFREHRLRGWERLRRVLSRAGHIRKWEHKINSPIVTIWGQCY